MKWELIQGAPSRDWCWDGDRLYGRSVFAASYTPFKKKQKLHANFLENKYSLSLY